MLQLLSLLAALVLSAYLQPLLLRRLGYTIGAHLRSKTLSRRKLLLARAVSEAKHLKDQATDGASSEEEWEKIDRTGSHATGDSTPEADNKDWRGIVGFLHPFCNAGGGGERVLWAAIRATQRRWPKALCVVYTGDHEVGKEQMLQRAQDRFNIELHAPNVIMLYLTARQYVLASYWPHFTLLGQSLGSLVLAYDAFSLVVPDIFIDTMGYAFSLALCKFFFPGCPTAAYVHYPTISTDMLGSLDVEPSQGRGLNAGAGKGLKGFLKRKYWDLFARLYSWVGGSVDVVMTNSSWTQSHIMQLWGPSRTTRKLKHTAEVVFPPCAVSELEDAISLDMSTEKAREPSLVYTSQFRPEKNHQLVLKSFASFLGKVKPQVQSGVQDSPRLVLIGSVRDSADETYIYSLRLLAHELHITSSVTFLLNAPWADVLSHLRTASVGINAMWNEHFGIGVVEYQAAGLISVVNDSGGPKNDIVVDLEDGPTGYHASTEEEYAEGFQKALALPPEEALAMRKRARKSSKRFDDDAFAGAWLNQMEKLVGLQMELVATHTGSTRE
ncbi:MAG: asparagine-linked glycosylation protein [Alyxoria varia]|nr:MAG: asparagine-linked glycosylation protein [Alyxoria varia]